MYPNTTDIDFHGSDIALFMIAICAVLAIFGFINMVRAWIRMRNVQRHLDQILNEMEADAHTIRDRNIN